MRKSFHKSLTTIILCAFSLQLFPAGAVLTAYGAEQTTDNQQQTSLSQSSDSESSSQNETKSTNADSSKAQPPQEENQKSAQKQPSSSNSADSAEMDTPQEPKQKATSSTTPPSMDTSSYYNYKFDKLQQLDEFKGSFQTNLFTGGGSYSYPIDVPPGRNGLQPSVVFSYSSHNRSIENLAGFGWNISMPEIRRLNTQGNEQMYERNDFYLDLFGSGGRLIPINIDGGYGLYGVQIEENFLRVILNRDLSWTVIDTKGTKYIFGKTADSRIESNMRLFRFLLDEVRDTNDNFIKYRYVKYDGQIYPSNITYTGHGSEEGKFEIRFVTEDRPDPILSYEAQWKIETKRLITEIQIIVDNTLRKKYQLRYQSHSQRKRLLLQQITEIGYDVQGNSLSLPPTVFEYSPLTTNNFHLNQADGQLFQVPFVEINRLPNGNIFPGDNGVRVADINGDGRTDIIKAFIDYYNNNGHDVVTFESYINRSYIENGVNTYQIQRDTINYQIPGRFSGYDQINNTPQYLSGADIFDYNGDYFPDLQFVVLNQSYPDDKLTFTNNKVNGWYGETIYPYTLAPSSPGIRDVNGDFLVDIVESNLVRTNPDQIESRVLLNRGEIAQPHQAWSAVLPLPLTNYADPYGSAITDVNGDNLADFVEGHLELTDGQLDCVFKNRVYLNTGAGYEANPSNWTFPVPLIYKSSVNGAQDIGVRFMDFNGDGLMDFLKGDSVMTEAPCRNFPLGTFSDGVYINNGVNGWYKASEITFGFPYFVRGSQRTDYGARIGDFNGDSFDDVLVHYVNNVEQQSYRGLFENTNTQPDVLTKITNPYQGKIEMNYRLSTSFLTDDKKIQNALPFVVSVVSKVTRNDNNGIISETSYTYRYGQYNYYDYFKKEFVGFGKVTETSGDKVTEYFFHTGDPLKMRPFDLQQIDYSYNTYADGQVMKRNANPAQYYVIDERKKRRIRSLDDGNRATDGYILQCMPYYSRYYANVDDVTKRKLILAPSFEELDSIPQADDVPFGYTEGELNEITCGNVLNNNPAPKVLTTDFALRGKLFKMIEKHSTSALYRTRYSKYGVADLSLDAGPDRERYFPKLLTEITASYDGGSEHKDTAVTRLYDNENGNVVQETQLGEVIADLDTGEILQDVLTSDTVTQEFTYADNREKHIWAYPRWITLKDINGIILKDERYYYDELAFALVEKGNLTIRSIHELIDDRFYDYRYYYDVQYYPNNPEKHYGLLKVSLDPKNYWTFFYYDGEVGGYPDGYPISTQYNQYVIAKEQMKDSIREWFHYDGTTGELDFYEDFNGQEIRKTYDPLGRVKLITLTNPNNNDLNSNYQSFTYIDTEFPSSVSYESYGGIEDETLKDPKVTAIKHFDGFGRLIQERVSDENSQYFTKSYQFDTLGRLKYETFQTRTAQAGFQTIDFQNTPKTAYEYDILDRPTKTIIASFGYTKNIYDKLTITTEDHEEGRDNEYFTKYVYKKDGFGRLREVNELYHETVYGPLTDTYRTFYEYDLTGNLKKIADASGNIREFTYDSMDRQRSADMIHKSDDFDFGKWIYTYDAASNVETATDPNGKTISYLYDILNRKTGELVDGIQKVAYTYDGDEENDNPQRNVKGRLSKVQHETGDQIFYNYDALGQVSRESKVINTVNYVQTYTRDMLGRMKQIVLPNQTAVIYWYNPSSALKTVKLKELGEAEKSLVNSISYNNRGQINQIQYGHGGRRDYGYYGQNRLYRLEALVTYKPNGAHEQTLYYSVDHAGNITGLYEGSNYQTTKELNMEYDSLGRLKFDRFFRNSDGTPGGRRDYMYSSVGNMFFKSGVGYYEYLKHDGNNANPHAMSGIQINDVTVTNFKYDRNGNLLEERGGDYTKTYEYDYNNQLTRANNENYEYDYAGNRVKKITGGKVTTYITQNYDSEAHRDSFYVYAGSELINTLEFSYNEPPIANAGQDQNVRPATVVTLDGRQSSDPDLDDLTFQWVMTSKPQDSMTQLLNADTAQPSFTADALGDYFIELKVNDGQEDNVADSVRIIAANRVPIADAGDDQGIHIGRQVTLDGSGSLDPDGDDLDYAWRFTARPQNSQAELQNANTRNPTFTPDLIGTYRVDLKVFDGYAQSAPDEVSATAENQVPIVNAGSDKTGYIDQAVTLNGTAEDADGDVLTPSWRFTQKPAQSEAYFTATGSLTTSFVPDKKGQYIVELIVSDGFETGIDSATVNILNRAPTANAGPDQTVKYKTTVRLNGSGSSDPDRDPITYKWRLVSKPYKSLARLNSDIIVNPTFYADKTGTYTVVLKVHDGTAWSSEDRVVITAKVKLVFNYELRVASYELKDSVNDRRLTANSKKQSLWSFFTIPTAKAESQIQNSKKELLPEELRKMDEELMEKGRKKIYWKKDPMRWEYQTKYHRKGLEEQRKAKEEFVLKYYPQTEWARSIRDQKMQGGNTKLRVTSYELRKDTKNDELTAKNKQKSSSGNTQSAGKRLIKKTLYYHFPDHLGSSNLVMDEAGNVVEISDYFPYGEVRVRQSFDNSFSTRKQFTGKEQDLTGLYYFGARYYDPRGGRFTQPDKVATFSPERILEDPQSLNTYAYARNNPIKFKDSDGNFAFLPILAGVVIGYISSLIFDPPEVARAPTHDSISRPVQQATSIAEDTIPAYANLSETGKALVQVGVGLVTGNVSGAGKQAIKQGVKIVEKKILKNEIKKDFVKISDSQFGKKIGKHASSYGLNPKNVKDRQRLRNHIYEIGLHPDKVLKGLFRGAGEDGHVGPVKFFIRGNDVVITKPNNEFVTVLKDGINNSWVQKAMNSSN